MAAPANVAEVSALFRAEGIENVKRQIASLDRANTSMATKVQRANQTIERRLNLLESATRHEGTREQALRKIEGVESTLNKIMERGNLTLDRRVQLEGHLARAQEIKARAGAGPAAAAAGGLGLGRVMGVGAAAIGGAFTVRAAMQGATLLADRYDDAEAATRRLGATSALTGAEIGRVRRFAEQAGDQFKLTTAATTEWSQQIFQLTSRAGQLGREGDVSWNIC